MNFTQRVENSAGRTSGLPGPTVCEIASEFYDNQSDATGGALYVADNAVVNVDGTTFGENTIGVLGGGNSGGAIHLEAGGDLTVANSNFKENTTFSSGEGGAIKQDDGTLTVTNSIFEENGADEGGAIYLRGAASNATIQNNWHNMTYHFISPASSHNNHEPVTKKNKRFSIQ